MRGLVDEFRLLLTALMYFTRIPVRRGGYGPERLADAARYFPLVGLLVGAVCAGIYLAALQAWSQPLAVALSMVAGLLLTGAFHEDGLADTADGFGGGWQREQVLRIMKDSRLGSYGACALLAGLGLKFLLLVELDAQAVPLALLVGHSLGRFLAGSLMRPLDYVREDEEAAKAKPVATRLGLGSLLVSALWPAAALAALLDWRPVLALLVVILMLRIYLVQWFRRRIGGYTGDTLGAAQQLGELACYLVLGVRWWT